MGQAEATSVHRLRGRGLVARVTGPGLAAEIDFDLIKRKTEAVLS